MTPLKALVGLVALLSEMVAREYRRVQLPHWPDGEQPLVDGSGIADTVWATMPQHSSAGSAAPEAGVDPGEGPTPGRDHTPGVGRNVTAGLLVSAAIGLREYADSDACEAPVYWRSVANQIDPKAP